MNSSKTSTDATRPVRALLTSDGLLLLDTNVVSAARKNDPVVASWIRRQGSATFALSVITLGEIASGIHLKQRRDPVAARHLANWLQRLRLDYRDRIFDIDEQIAEEWGRIDAIRTRSMADGLIAATAIVHGMRVVTRNVADFIDTGAEVINPWAK